MSEKLRLVADGAPVSSRRVSIDIYDEDYYERGAIVGKSGYMNYSWMPELTIRMAHFMIMNLGISRNDRVLDYGCAKGFLVKAFRILGINAEGVDVSRYAIDYVDAAVKQQCRHITGHGDEACFRAEYDLMIAKDVLEHIAEDDLRDLLPTARKSCKKIFAAIPVAADDTCGKFVVPEYDKDVTHVTAKSVQWWWSLFESTGWHIDQFAHTFPGMKQNWTDAFAKGNAFFTISAGNS